jgi:UMF1 family MFS transporter
VDKAEKSWLLYDVANSAFVLIVITTIMPMFYKDVVATGIDAASATANWGFANSLASAVVAVSAPILGTFADYRFYKKRFLMAFLVLGAAFTFLLAFVDPGDHILALVLYAVARIGFAGANVFYDAFLTDVADRDRMDWVSSCGYAAGYIGAVIPFLGVLAVVVYLDDGSGITLSAARISFVIVAVWWLVLSIPLLKHVQQKYDVPVRVNPIREGFGRFLQTFRSIRQYKAVFTFLLAYFFYIDGVNTIITMSAAYGRDIGLGTTQLILVILMIQVVAFPFALIYGKLAGRFSTKPVLIWGLAVYILAAIISFFLPDIDTPRTKLILFWGLAFLIATSLGGIQALSRSFLGKLIPPERSAEFFGFYNVFGKFAAIAGPFLMGMTGQIAGHSRYGVLTVLGLLVVGGVLLWRVEPARASSEAEAGS